MGSVLQYIRKNIRSLTPYKSARSEFTGKAEIFIDANENPYQARYNRYPDAYQKKLKQALSEVKGVVPNQIVLGNGSDELIDLLIRIFCIPGQDHVLTYKPGFSMYLFAAQVNDVSYTEVPLEKDFTLDIDKYIASIQENTMVIFLCSPNNPTGTIIPSEDIIKLCEGTDKLVVVDEAYIDFTEEESSISLLDRFENLVVLQTFSKALGGAGLRIGMAYASTELSVILNAVRMPYNISQSNQDAALSLLADRSNHLARLSEIKAQKFLLAEKLTSLSIVEEVIPSKANFLLTRFKNSDEVLTALRRKGIIVRDRSKNYMCENCLRISIGTPDENALLMQALNKLSTKEILST